MDEHRFKFLIIFQKNLLKKNGVVPFFLKSCVTLSFFGK